MRGVLAGIRERRATWQTGAHPRDPVFAEWISGRESASGVTVTPTNAMQVSAVIACVRRQSETVAGLPLPIYKRLEGSARERDRGHPLYPVLNERPNRWQTAFEFWDYMLQSFLLRGNEYALRLNPSAEWPGGQLIPLHPDRVHPFRAPDGSRAYSYQPEQGAPVVYLQDEIFHTPFMPDDGYNGVSVIKYASEIIGGAIVQQESTNRFHANDATPGGTLNHPGKLSKEATDNLEEKWNEAHRGTANRRKIAVLKEGMKFEPIGVTPEDAQALQRYQLSLEDIARIFLTPPHKIGLLDRATWANIEHQQIEWVQDTIMSICIRREQTIHRDLFTADMRRTHFVEYLLDGLKRGDAKSEAESLEVMRRNGVLSGDEWRAIKNMNPLPDGAGRTYQMPLNMTVASLDGLSLAQRWEAAGAGVRAGYEPAGVLASVGLPPIEHLGMPPVTLQQVQVREAFRPLFEEAIRRIARREQHDAGRTPVETRRSQHASDLAPLITAFARSAMPAADVGESVTAFVDAMAVRLEGTGEGDGVIERELRLASAAFPEGETQP